MNIPNIYPRNEFSSVGSVPNEYVPPRVGSPPSVPGACHGLFDLFMAQFPAQVCRQSAVCAALDAAEIYTAGFVIEQAKRNQAVIFMAAHLLAMGESAAAESLSRASAIASGNVSIPSPNSPGIDDWLGFRPWGLAFAGLRDRNARLGALAI
jgi:hypothetical protein